LCAYIELSKARLIISTIDNSPLLYQIKSFQPNVQVVVIQNGRRDTIAKHPGRSFVNELAQLNRTTQCQVDFYLTFGSTEKAQFESLISCSFVSLGSLKNNLIRKIPDPKNNVLTFVTSLTQDCAKIESSPQTPIGFAESVPIPLQTYFEADFIVALWLSNYALNNGLTFQILGKRSVEYPEQEILFRNRIPGDWKFLYCNSEYDSYSALLNSELIAGVDSTLLYEMFGRGKRTAFFTIRKSVIGIGALDCPNFGYPEIKDEVGPMWTNRSDVGEFERLMKTIRTTSEEEWKGLVSTYGPIVMNWDPANESLVSVLKSLGFPPQLGGVQRSEIALGAAHSSLASNDR
jgi:surface carbohydrate biosynthesis protein